MKLSLLLLTLVLASATAAHSQERDSTAQDASDEPIALGKVVVERAHIVKKGNEIHFYPTPQQKEAATNAYTLLARIAPPELRVDALSHSITPLTNKGAVEVRINGIVASTEDLLALNPAMVQRVEYSSSHHEGATYRYGVRSRNHALFSEALYEHKLRPFSLATGAQFSLTHTDNTYSGDANARSRMTRQNLYLFGEINGQRGSFSYTGGVGLTHIDFHQDGHHVRFSLLRPKVSLQQSFGENTQLAYTFQTNSHVSQIASTSDVAIRLNSME